MDLVDAPESCIGNLNNVTRTTLFRQRNAMKFPSGNVSLKSGTIIAWISEFRA
jgi:hypothetical protein